jgi:tRNA pseudouridine55 synthase
LTDTVSGNERLESPFILPIDSIFSEFPSLSLGETDTRKVKNGASCRLRNTADGKYRVYAPDGGFLLLGEVKRGEMKTIKSFFEIND